MAFFTDLRAMPTIRYTTPDVERRYKPLTHLRWFVLTDIPEVPHHLSMYLHALMVATEVLCGEEDAPPARIRDEVRREQWTTVHDKVTAYWFRNREKMDGEHRRILWCCLTRIKFVLFRGESDHREIHACSFARDRHIQMTRTRIPQHSLRELWQTLYALQLSWCTLRIDGDVQHYTNALATQTGRFLYLASTNRQIFNYSAYMTTVDKFENVGVIDPATGVVTTHGDHAEATYCVNESFILETERIFYVLFRDIATLTRVADEYSTVETAPRAVSYPLTMDWIESSIALEARREGVATLFEKRAYTRRALPGEIERFKEKDPHQEHDAYNTIAQFRPNVIDATSEMLAAKDNLEQFVAHARTWDPATALRADDPTDDENPETPLQARRRVRDEAERSADAEDVLLAAACLMLDGAFSSDTMSFMDMFTVTSVPVPRTKRRIPLLVRVGGAWCVAMGDTFYNCETIVDAIEKWLRLLCSSTKTLRDIAYIAPNTDIFFEAHRIITGEGSVAERERDADFVAGLRTTAIRLPACYGGASAET